MSKSPKEPVYTGRVSVRVTAEQDERINHLALSTGQPRSIVERTAIGAGLIVLEEMDFELRSVHDRAINRTKRQIHRSLQKT